MIIYLYGLDTWRSRQKLRELREKFRKDVDPTGDNIKKLDGEKMTLSDLSSAFSTGSLFAKRRMIIVENIFLNKSKSLHDEVFHFLDMNERRVAVSGQNDDNIIIIVDDEANDKPTTNKLKNFLMRQKFVQPFPPLSIPAINKWVIEKMEKESCAISPADAMKISGLYGNDLWKIESEVNKLISYAKGKSGKLISAGMIKIEKSDLDILSPGKVDENIFALTDAIANKDRAKAMELLENEMEAGKADVYLLNMITRQFKILLQLRQALDNGYGQKKISTDLKMHPYVIQKSMRQAKNFSFLVLKDIFEKLINLDIDLKTGKADFKLSIGLLISNL